MPKCIYLENIKRVLKQISLRVYKLSKDCLWRQNLEYESKCTATETLIIIYFSDRLTHFQTASAHSGTDNVFSGPFCSWVLPSRTSLLYRKTFVSVMGDNFKLLNTEFCSSKRMFPKKLFWWLYSSVEEHKPSMWKTLYLILNVIK